MYPSYRIELSATVVQLGAILFAILITSLHFLKPVQNIIGRPTSDYAVGEYGFLMSAAYIILSITSWALIYSLNRSLSNPKKVRVPFIFLFIWSVCLWIAMIFPIDIEGAELTTTGIIHRINGPFALLMLNLGLVFMSLHFKRDERFERIFTPALILSLLIALSFIATFITIATGTGFTGLAQRVGLTLIISWFIIVSTHIKILSKRKEFIT